MKRDNTGCIRGYHRLNLSWYGKYATDENIQITFGMYDPEGGTSGDMYIEWIPIGKNIPTPQLKVFDDGWSNLGLFTDVIEELAKVDSEYITDDQFCEILDRLGFKDLTAYENPNPSTDKLISIEIWESKAKKLGLI